MKDNNILKITNLSITYKRIEAVKDFNLTLNAGERFCLVGESGSGKSSVANAIAKLLPEYAKINGEILLQNKDIYKLDAKELRELRRKYLSIIFQDAIGSLIPTLTIKKQLSKVIKSRLGISKSSEIRVKVIEYLNKVGLTDYENILESYPNQLSGGMCQRIMIIMALCIKPSLVIADEPTSALDVLTQQKILDLIIGLQHELDFALVFITHDMRIAAHYSDYIGVLQKGTLIEMNESKLFFKNPQHLYSKQLIESAKLLSI